MKKLLFCVVMILKSFCIYTQDTITVKLSEGFPIEKQEYIKPGNYVIQIIPISSLGSLKYILELQEGQTEKIEAPKFSYKKKKIVGEQSLSLGLIKLFNGDTIKIFIEQIDNPKLKSTYTYIVGRKARWSTTFGYNIINNVKSESYFLKEATDSTYTIQNSETKSLLLPLPTFYFNWMPNPGPGLNWGVGGSIGTNLQELSLGLGFNIFFGENIVLTTGISVYGQERLARDLDKQEEYEDISRATSLTEKYFSPAFSIGLSFRFKENIFKE